MADFAIDDFVLQLDRDTRPDWQRHIAVEFQAGCGDFLDTRRKLIFMPRKIRAYDSGRAGEAIFMAPFGESVLRFGIIPGHRFFPASYRFVTSGSALDTLFSHERGRAEFN